jgi:hypothetical protein
MKVFIWPGEQGVWHFAYVSKRLSHQLRTQYKHMSRGFSSLRVHVTVGSTSWDTSIFYDHRSEQYLLPLKLAVRKKEGIAVDDTVPISFTLR